MSVSLAVEEAPAPVPPPRRRTALVALVAAFFVLFAIGMFLRVDLLVTQRIDADQAFSGVMAHLVLHGHFYTFLLGNQYSGGEFYLESLMTAVFGSGPVVIQETAVILTFIAAVALWRAARNLVRPELWWLAPILAGLFWVWPEAAVWNSTREFGFRQLTMVAGVTAILMAVRTIRNWNMLDAAGTGLALGLGLWSSPEIVYFAVIVALMIGASVVQQRIAACLRGLAAMAVGFFLGALPWIWTNLHTGFASLSKGSSPTYNSSTYTGRLSLFFHRTLPMMLGLRRTYSALWFGGRAGQALYVVCLLVLVALCLVGLSTFRRAGGLPVAACSAGLLLFPFEYANFPATSFWVDGHYAVFCVPLILLVVAGVMPPRLVWRPALPAVVAATSLFMVVLTLSAYDAQFLSHRGITGLFHRGHNPYELADVSIADLEANHIRYAYANYWVAYQLDFLSHERLRIADPSFDRWPAQYHEVQAATDPAWVFYAPDRTGTAGSEFDSTIVGPWGYPEALFISRLAPLHIGYRIVHLGVLDAVVTDRAVRPAQVGMGPPTYP